MNPGLYRAAGAGALAALLTGAATPAPADIREDCLKARRTTGGWQVCRRAVGAHPKDPDVRRNYAISLSFNGAYDSAARQYAAVTRLTPNSHRAHYELGWFYAFKRQYGEAVRPIERAMALKPRHLKYMRLAAIIFAATKLRQKRFAIVREAAELGDQIMMFELAFLYADGDGVKENLAETLKWLIRAANKGHVLAMDRLADAYLNGKLGAKKDRKRADFWARKAQQARDAN